MCCTATATEPQDHPRPAFDGSRVDARHRRAAIRDEALRLARESSGLPEGLRWSYLQALRAAARRDQPLSAVELPLVTEPVVPSYDAPVDPLPPGSESAEGYRLRRFALMGVISGLAAAVLLPSSLSESLPWTSGNERSSGAPIAGEGIGAREAEHSNAAAAVAPSARDARARQLVRSRDSARERREGAGTTRRRLRIGAGAVSGTGDRDFGTLHVDRPVILRWSGDGRPFTIRSMEWSLRPRGRTGSAVLTPGAYRRFAVRSSARWRIKLDPTQ